MASTPPAVTAAKNMAKSAKTVTVGSKLPQSIYLQRSAPRTSKIPGRYGPEDETVYVPFGPRVVIRGTAVPVAVSPRDLKRMGYTMPRIEEGAALTRGVDAEWFALWMEEHAGDEWVQGGLIFAHAQEASVLDWAREHEGLRSGLEPIDPEDLDRKYDDPRRDPRLPRPMNSGVSLSETPEAA